MFWMLSENIETTHVDEIYQAVFVLTSFDDLDPQLGKRRVEKADICHVFLNCKVTEHLLDPICHCL